MAYLYTTYNVEYIVAHSWKDWNDFIFSPSQTF